MDSNLVCDSIAVSQSSLFEIRNGVGQTFSVDSVGNAVFGGVVSAERFIPSVIVKPDLMEQFLLFFSRFIFSLVCVVLLVSAYGLFIYLFKDKAKRSLDLTPIKAVRLFGAFCVAISFIISYILSCM